jgi:hypothetical protein
VTLSAQDWLDSLVSADRVIQHLSAKGSIIKFCIVETEEDHESLHDGLVRLSRDEGLDLLTVDSGLMDVSVPENIVKQLAGELDMGRLIDAFVSRAWRESGYPNARLVSASRVAAEHGVGLPELLPAVTSSVRRLLDGSSDDSRAPAFNRDFKNALRVLTALTNNEGADSRMRAQLIVAFNSWLSGIAPAHILKMLQVQWKLRRTNATQILRSILALPPLTGARGSVLHLDFRSVTNPELQSGTPSVNYTKHKRTGTYQWLREIIDQTYMFDSTLIIVEAGPAFLDQSANGPGIGRYDALKFRILDDVKSAVDNPSSVITHISG